MGTAAQPLLIDLMPSKPVPVSDSHAVDTLPVALFLQVHLGQAVLDSAFSSTPSIDQHLVD